MRTDIKGRLLTPEEGCGQSIVINKRIVGGTVAEKGAWPWIALIGRENHTHVSFACGKSRKKRNTQIFIELKIVFISPRA